MALPLLPRVTPAPAAAAPIDADADAADAVVVGVSAVRPPLGVDGLLPLAGAVTLPTTCLPAGADVGLTDEPLPPAEGVAEGERMPKGLLALAPPAAGPDADFGAAAFPFFAPFPFV